MDSNNSEIEKTTSEKESDSILPKARPAVDAFDWILTVAMGIAFIAVLFVFEIIERVVFALRGRIFLKRNVTPSLSRWLIRTLSFTLAEIHLPEAPALDPNIPYIIVSNHQSMFDIPFIGWVFRNVLPQYVSKVELGRGIPAISYSLRTSGDVLIDRSNSGQALKELVRFGRRINEENSTAVIFPEGTRARDGELKGFKPAGIAALLKSAPRAKVMTVTIEGSWKLQCYPHGPIPRSVDVQLVIGPVLDPQNFPDSQAVVDACRSEISRTLERLRSK